jgi:hypothetical protein
MKIPSRRVPLNKEATVQRRSSDRCTSYSWWRSKLLSSRAAVYGDQPASFNFILTSSKRAMPKMDATAGAGFSVIDESHKLNGDTTKVNFALLGLF